MHWSFFQNRTLLEFFGDEASKMFEAGLDTINESNNTVVRHMNGRVDEIRDSMHDAMHNQQMMEFMGLALGMPIVGLGMLALGAPVSTMALLSIAAPMYLLRFLTNGPMQRTQEVYHHVVNVTVPLGDEHAHN